MSQPLHASALHPVRAVALASLLAIVLWLPWWAFGALPWSADMPWIVKFQLTLFAYSCLAVAWAGRSLYVIQHHANRTDGDGLRLLFAFLALGTTVALGATLTTGSDEPLASLARNLLFVVTPVAYVSLAAYEILRLPASFLLTHLLLLVTCLMAVLLRFEYVLKETLSFSGLS